LEKAQVETIKMVFSYRDGNNYVFMNNNTYEIVEIHENRLEWEKKFITDGTEVTIQKHNEEILGATLPDQIVAEVTEAEEAVQGNTVQSVQKKAWISTGYEILVPQFVRKGDRVLIDTTSGIYVGRTK
jgi:elongation factor P